MPSALRLVLPALLLVLSLREARPASVRRVVVPEFAALAELLRQRQGITLGTPVGDDAADGPLVHFQRFADSDETGTRATFEEHSNGTVYLSFAPAAGPRWYDVLHADDTEEFRDRAIAVGRGRRRFADVLEDNVNEATWVPTGDAFPPGRGAAARWLTFALPVLDPCAADRARLAALEAATDTTGESHSLLARIHRAVERALAGRLRHRLAGLACRRRPTRDWLAALTARDETRPGVVPRTTPPLPASGDYCFRDVVSKLDPLLGNSGPPEWQTLLPVDSGTGGVASENGQRRLYPEHRPGAPGNHVVSWEEVVRLSQVDPARALRVLRWGGHPTREDIKDRVIPWVSSAVDGVVTNSFLSGSDYAGDHQEPPPGYWLGTSPPTAPEGCGTFNAQHALCNDWIVFLRPDPEYGFVLAYDQPRDGETEADDAAGLGNFTSELRGNLENEVEQWLVPVGYRPDPGDRIHLAGRWVVDCGHADWHAELHPIEAFASSHTTDTRAGGETVASVVVTGDWLGGALELDLWPTARPAASAALAWRRDHTDAGAGLAVTETPAPADDPNHLHIEVSSVAPWRPLVTGDWNDVEPHPKRRLATRYHLWWVPKSSSASARVR